MADVPVFPRRLSEEDDNIKPIGEACSALIRLPGKLLVLEVPFCVED